MADMKKAAEENYPLEPTITHAYPPTPEGAVEVDNIAAGSRVSPTAKALDL